VGQNANGGVASPHSLKASGAAKGGERDGRAGGGGARVKEEEAPNRATRRRSGRRGVRGGRGSWGEERPERWHTRPPPLRRSGRRGEGPRSSRSSSSAEEAPNRDALAPARCRRAWAWR
jgi:hypothetical protein